MPAVFVHATCTQLAGSHKLILPSSDLVPMASMVDATLMIPTLFVLEYGETLIPPWQGKK